MKKLEIACFFSFVGDKLLIVKTTNGLRLPGIKNPDNMEPKQLIKDKFEFKKNRLIFDGLLFEAEEPTENVNFPVVHAKVYLLKTKIDFNQFIKNNKQHGEFFEYHSFQEILENPRTLPVLRDSILAWQGKQKIAA